MRDNKLLKRISTIVMFPASAALIYMADQVKDKDIRYVAIICTILFFDFIVRKKEENYGKGWW